MYKKGNVIIAKVTNIQKKIFFAKTFDNYTTIVFINEVSDFFVNNINHYVKVDSDVFLKIIKVEQEEKKIICSFKKLNPILLKDPFNFEIQETKKGFTNLLRNTKWRAKQWKKYT